MFELSVALKYLTPRWKQLSVSIISTISILVIALVVWLIVVFFSVTHGLESSWLQKLTALTAPVRITPTPAYYNSYYYQQDAHSALANYTLKSIAEKLSAEHSETYDPSIDSELSSLLIADRDSEGHLIDPVKTAFAIIANIPEVSHLSAHDFEMSVANLKLRLIRKQPNQQWSQTNLTQTAYLGSIDPDNEGLLTALLKPAEEDLANLAVSQSLPLTAEQNSAEFIDETLFDQSLTQTHRSQLWAHAKQLATGKKELIVPSSSHLGDGILLPRSYKEAGAMLGDRGFISYYSPTLSAVQEQRLPVYVAGFYDPGIIPIGGKFVLANKNITSIIRSAHDQGDSFVSNGINVRFEPLEHADQVKAFLIREFEKAGILKYWKIETYREFEFTKDLIQQLRSERNLWTLIATVIIIVACSNIISMLIILVNDKKKEIGILRSLGATSFSIAAIFGFCGIVMGMVGSIIGTLVALLTLRNLQALVDWIGHLQGYEMFNPVFYGNSLPNQISADALLFVIVATAVTSLIAGVVPAVKACMLRPSTILRSE